MFLRLSCALIGPRRAPAADLKSNQVVPDELAGCLGLTASELAAPLGALNALPAEDRFEPARLTFKRLWVPIVSFASPVCGRSLSMLIASSRERRSRLRR